MGSLDFLPETGWLTYVLVALVLLIGLYAYSTWTFSFFKQRGIPYVKPWPLLGNLGDIARRGMQVCDAEYLRKYGNVVGTFTGRTPALLVGDMELIKKILVKDFNYFTNRPSSIRLKNKMMDLMLTRLVDDHWKSVRNTLSPAFSSGKLKLMIKQMNLCSKQLVDHLASYSKSGESFDVQEFTGAFTMDTIAQVSFGVHLDSQADKNSDFLKHGKAVILSSITSFKFMLVLLFPFIQNILIKLGFDLGLFPSSSVDFFSAVVKQTADQRQNMKQTSKDFLQLMLDAHNLTEEEEEEEEGPEMNKSSDGKRLKRRLTEDEVLAQGILFFLAGYDTTATSLTYALYNLATNPECQDRLREDIREVMQDRDYFTYDDLQNLPYLKQVLEESLRMFPLGIRIVRMTSCDVDIGGFSIPKNTQVHIPAYAIHYNPDYYPDPQRFDPDRFSPAQKATRDPYTYLPFGMGPRNCIGMRLALVEMQIAIAKLVQKYKVVPSEDTEIPLQLKPSLAKPKKPVKLKLVPV